MEKPLSKKLGIKHAEKVLLLGEKVNYLKYFPDIIDIEVVNTTDEPTAFIHIFTRSQTECKELINLAKKHLVKNGTLWVSWPKLSSKQSIDLSENDARQIGLAAGLVDVKIAAIDRIWSGLKFVFRLIDR